MTSVERLLRRIASLGQARGIDWALVGGLAISVRTEPRFTRDVDLAVSAGDDERAEAIVSHLVGDGYRVEAIVEQEAADRIATVRLRREGAGEEPYLDLLFASSGIEDRIVEAAEELEVLPGVSIGVASAEHLLATKILAVEEARPQDRADAIALAETLDAAGVERARRALGEIEARGFHRGRDLTKLLNEIVTLRVDPDESGS